jgi:hypothetical protein
MPNYTADELRRQQLLIQAQMKLRDLSNNRPDLFVPGGRPTPQQPVANNAFLPNFQTAVKATLDRTSPRVEPGMHDSQQEGTLEDGLAMKLGGVVNG